MSYSSEVLADSPVAYYRMDEVSGLIQDSSGNANHATSTLGAGSATYGEPGAIASDPTSKSIKVATFGFDVPDHASLDWGDVVTVEAWAKRNGIGTYQYFAVKGFSVSSGTTVRFNPSNELELVSEAVGIIAESSVTITDTTGFHHFVTTWNGTTSKIYIDGVDATTPQFDLTLLDNADPLRIGLYDATTFLFNGWLDELAFYPTDLSQARVQAHFDAASAIAPAPSDDPPVGLLGRGAGW